MSPSDSRRRLGQFFTTSADVQKVMGSLIRTRNGAALEPSCGQGDLVKVLETRPGLTVTAVELDRTVAPRCATPVTHADFFTFANTAGRFRVILGNPPYVAWKAVGADTRRSAFSVKGAYNDKTNLYHLFIDRSIDLLAPGGELILIVPKEWLYSTSAAPLRDKMSRSGALTHLIDCGERKLFVDADVPALMIFRYQHGAAQKDVRFAEFEEALDGRYELRRLRRDGTSWMLLRPELDDAIAGWATVGAQFDVHVGMVSGLDRVFRLDGGRIPSRGVSWQVTTARKLEPFIDVNDITAENKLPQAVRRRLVAHKDALLARRIARFDESNWWRYGAVRNRDVMESGRPRIFALVKTRSATPFFAVPGARYFAGGVLGLFRRRDATVTVRDALRLLNSAAYREVLEAMQLTSGDKVSLQPATLARAPFPTDRAALRAFLAERHAPRG